MPLDPDPDPTLHGLTPAMRELVVRIGRARKAPITSLSPRDARRAYRAMAEVLEPVPPPVARVEDFTLPADDGTPLAARLYAAASEISPLPVLLYLHGGGFVIGDLDTHDKLCRELAARSGGAVVALAYRLAPEHPFPIAADDTFAAMRWLAQHAITLGLDGSRLAIGGDSAGGTLAATAAIHARDIGLRLALQVLITPGTAARADSPSHRRHRHGPLLDADLIEWFFGHYAPEPSQRENWRFAPLNADELEGVAPAFVLLAECDPLVDEGLAYADKLRAAQVPVQLDLVRGMAHDFIKMGRAIKEAQTAKIDIALALREAWDKIDA